LNFKPFIFPTCTDAAVRLQFVRELSENCTLRPALFSPCCKPWVEFVLTPIPAAARIVSWHPDGGRPQGLNSQLPELSTLS